jgi:hypothetical protein
MRQRTVAARPVRHLGVELIVGHQRDDLQRRADEAVQPSGELRRRQDRPGLLVELQKGDDLRDVLREDELVAPRQDRDRARADTRQLSPSGWVFENVDRLELDPTDREKLLESQTAGSTRLPERLQRRARGHLLLLIIRGSTYAGPRRGVNSRGRMPGPTALPLWALLREDRRHGNS